jgi:hypothetical protein
MSANDPAHSPIDMKWPELYLYGATMLSVQMWEMAVATLRFAFEIDPKRKPKALDAEIQRAIKRAWHFYKRSTASENAKALKGSDLDADVLSDVGNLLPIRDRLAHRYLRENIGAIMDAAEKGLPADPTIALELLRFDMRFEASKTRLTEAFQKIIDGLGRGDPGEASELFNALGQSILTGTPLELPENE